jgi:hypothetical protein
MVPGKGIRTSSVMSIYDSDLDQVREGVKGYLLTSQVLENGEDSLPVAQLVLESHGVLLQGFQARRQVIGGT